MSEVITKDGVSAYYTAGVKNPTTIIFHNLVNKEGNTLCKDLNGWYFNDNDQADILLRNAAAMVGISDEELTFLILKYG